MTTHQATRAVQDIQRRAHAAGMLAEQARWVEVIRRMYNDPPPSLSKRDMLWAILKEMDCVTGKKEGVG